MAYLDTTGLNTLWGKIKATFGASLGLATSSTGADIALKNAASTPAQLSSITIPLVDKANSKAGLMDPADKTKLDGIEAGAEANVQADWNVTDTSSDAYIKNKPSVSDTQVTNTKDNTASTIYVTGTTSSSTNTGTQKFNTNVYVGYASSKTTLHASYFAGDGTSITNLNPTNITGNVAITHGGTGAASAADARTNLDVYSTSEVDSMVAGFAKYVGTLASDSAFTGLTNYKQGNYWIASASFSHTLADSTVITVDAGNMIFANTTAAAYYAANFDIVSTDIEAIPDSVINALS